MARFLSLTLSFLCFCPGSVLGNWGEPVRLPYPVNVDPDSGYSRDPFLTRDGHQLYFSSSRSSSSWSEDIWVVRWNGSTWDSLTDLFPGRDPSLSSDLKKLYFVASGGYGSADIWVRTWQDTGWSDPQNLGSNINSPYVESSACISRDGSTIYVAAIRRYPGCYDQDIWTSHWDGSDWTPMTRDLSLTHLGDEFSPFISADDSVLYSVAWMEHTAGKEVFRSHRQNGSWSERERLPSPINTASDEDGPCLSPDRSRLYFASNRQDTIPGSLDYSVYVSAWDSTGVEVGTPQLAGSGRIETGPIYPSPGGKEVRIRYRLEERSRVTLVVYDFTGRKVKTLSQGEESRGEKEVVLRLESQSNGVYLLQLRAGEWTSSRRIVLVR